MENSIVLEIEELEGVLKQNTKQESNEGIMDHSAHLKARVSLLRDTLNQVVERVMGTMQEHMERVMDRMTRTKEKTTRLEKRLEGLKRKWMEKGGARKAEKKEAILELSEIQDQIKGLTPQIGGIPAPEEMLQFDGEQLFWKVMEGVKVKLDLRREKIISYWKGGDSILEVERKNGSSLRNRFHWTQQSFKPMRECTCAEEGTSE